MSQDKDPAKEMASQMFEKPYDEVTPEERRKAKNHPAFWLSMYGSSEPLKKSVRVKSLHKEMLDAGLVIGHHESDLYVKNCPEARDILERHPISKANAERFISQTGEGPCLDIPFMYDKNLGDDQDIDVSGVEE